jgi:MGT family glycosyltransferase
MLLVVRSLIERGHTVIWYAASKFRLRIESTGATFASMTKAPDWDDADVESAFPALRKLRGLALVKAQLEHMFIAPMQSQLHDLTQLAVQYNPDILIADSAHLGAAALSEARGIPWATLGVSALIVASKDTAPFGPGWSPSSSRLGRWRNRFLSWLVFRVMFRNVNRAYRMARLRSGLPVTDNSYFDILSPHLYLQPTVKSFEYERSDLPSQIQFIGALVPNAGDAAAELPPWWPDVQDAHRRGVPVVMITQGTLATDPSELLLPAMQGLAKRKLLMIVTSKLLSQDDAPANARVASFIPYHAAMPLLSAVITNGGYGGVQMALYHGVPLVVAGGSEEKPEIAARVAWCGAGVNLRTGRPRPTAVDAAVQRIFADASFAERARKLGAEMQKHDAATESALLIEKTVNATRGQRYGSNPTR